MTQTAAPPVLTVRYNGAERTFAAGHDVVIGRDLRADVRVADPLISRVHLLLRFDQGRWIAIDNGSLNGLYINNRRVPVVDIQDGQRVNIGNPDGPALDFGVGRRQQGSVGRPPPTAVMQVPPPMPSGAWPSQAPPQTGSHRPVPPQPAPPTTRMPAQPPSGPQHVQPSAQQPQYPSGPQTSRSQTGAQPAPQIYRPPGASPAPPAPLVVGRAPGETGNIATSMMKILRPGRAAGELPPGAVTIGRADDNDIVIPEVLASRHHATLIPTPQGTEIRDNRSINGTFVNGARVEAALLHDGDVVTIGNIDLIFANGALARREESLLETRTGGLDVHGVTWTIEGNKTLLDNISLAARPGMLTAVIGPSGAGKSTFARLVAGYTHPTNGTVTFEGHNIHAEYASLRSRIGMVPQDDVVHGQLTVRQALMYAAELRLPPDTTKEDREQVVARVLEELEMSKHLETRVDKLSGGQRKRASVALELLTGPSLLILDEPTSGLDPALDRQVMTMLRQLADAGRVVLVVTHSLTYLDVCDQVLLLAPGGKTAFCGPPSQIGPAMGTTNWADIFSTVADDPEGAQARYLAQTGPPPPAPPVERPGELGGDPSHTSLFRQFSTIARRQMRLIISDRGYFIFLAILPFIMGSLSMSVPGDVGFGMPNPMGNAPNEPGQILVLLNVGAVFMGTALTIRDLIGERAIFRREQAVGLSTTAYLLAKICVYTVFAVVQSAIVTIIVLIGKGGPTQGAVALGKPGLELFADVAATCVASAMLGLALSAVAKSNEQIMPLLVVAVMSQLVFSGGMIPVTDRLGLDQMSWATPARWGFATSASTVDLIKLVPGPLTPKDSHWHHTAGAWWFDMAMLAFISLCYVSFVRWKIRLKGG
ncbi:ABC transporter ATP-binding/permease Rv1747 [Mycobacterium marinum]|uniref:FHA domain-containing protein n=2 Tax=Mycobacterium marinum TaxID=1781 RepID=UPI00045FBB58|nr:FHA domain-containing protein [Mycobacterium marinum]WCS20627.1 ATP-binding cassette domain-containing protein [Mycobacterium marinum]WOR06926.1 ATP-binding cassette domain-containing protein [Mycobacterium marinum]CDM76679.1 conserved transmembrane ATP-binding protein ABC transporter [Mycobacterium marinum E11]GJO02989.1 ABC transporter ATP-binding/permease Rv1747 [Mycobacterium marinum]GJO08069.1 ABC transporter ATP-binding/permease Rv1747 [Mycobacterium marinum]